MGAYRVGGFMAKREVCADCAAVINRRIKAGMSDTVPTPTALPFARRCADCAKFLPAGKGA